MDKFIKCTYYLLFFVGASVQINYRMLIQQEVSYVDLINISQEFDIKLNKILEFINLPNENEYNKFKRNITKKFNKLENMNKLIVKNKDQINSLKTYNLVLLKKMWIDGKIIHKDN